MKNYLVAALAAGALTACGGGATNADADGDGTITQDEVNAAVSGVSLNPGQWENTVEFVDIKMDESKLPPEARGLMSGMLESMKGQINTTTDCMTPEEAENPQAEMFSGNDNAECEYDRFDFGGGTMDICRIQPGLKIVGTGYRRVTWRPFRALTCRQTGHLSLRIGVEEKRSRITFLTAGIGDPVRR